LYHDDWAACQSSADIAMPWIPVGMILDNFISGVISLVMLGVCYRRTNDKQSGITLKIKFNEMSHYSATAVNIFLQFSTSYVCDQAVSFLTNSNAKILMFDILMYKKLNMK